MIRRLSDAEHARLAKEANDVLKRRRTRSGPGRLRAGEENQVATCKSYAFVVKGSGAFPVDMLRYDQCWPTSTEAAMEIKRGPRDEWDPAKKDGPYFQTREVAMASHKHPTGERWASFGWDVLAKMRDGSLLTIGHGLQVPGVRI